MILDDFEAFVESLLSVQSFEGPCPGRGHQINPPLCALEHPDAVTCVAFSPNNRRWVARGMAHGYRELSCGKFGAPMPFKMANELPGVSWPHDRTLSGW